MTLTIATAFIHSTLGGTLFTLNALGYVVLAAAMVLPIGFFHEARWLTRIALIGYTAATVIGWYLIGPRYDTAYIAKGIELVLIALLVVESYHRDGSPVRIARRIASYVGMAARSHRARRPVDRTGPRARPDPGARIPATQPSRGRVAGPR